MSLQSTRPFSVVAGVSAVAILLAAAPDASAQCEIDAISIPDTHGFRLHLHGDVVAVPAQVTLAPNAVHVYRRTGLSLQHEAVLMSPPDLPEHSSGSEIHVHGDWIAIADYHELSTGGMVQLYRHEAGEWTHVQTLAAPADARWFGRSIAILGDRMVIGAPKWMAGLGTPFDEVGRAYVYELDGSTWTLAAELANPGDGFLDHFGWSVGLATDRIAIGAPNVGFLSGRVFLFEQISESWELIDTLSPTPSSGLARFGHALDANDSAIVVGASATVPHGRVYHFDWSGAGSWISGSDLPITPGKIDDSGDGLPVEQLPVEFGVTVALSESGTRVLAGAMNDSEAGLYAGAAFLLTVHDGTWSLVAKLIDEHAQDLANFGANGAMDDDFALIISGNANIGVTSHVYAGMLGLDCNRSGQPDACDIFFGESRDSNNNLVPDECELLGDLNGDGVVDVIDLLLLLSAWGPCDMPGDCPADLNGDGIVDVFDLLIQLSHWS